jgi:hypothetical protein
VTRRGAALALAWAVVTLVVVVAVTLTACGEKDDRAPGISRADVRALVAAGLAAVASDAPPSGIAFSANGPTLHVTIAAPPSDGALSGLLASFRGVHAEIEQFCPKPALLRCRPSLRAWATPLSRHAVESSVIALRQLAAEIYGRPPLVRRGGPVTRIVTPNGELLAAVRTDDATVSLSFGGLAPPRGPAEVVTGGLEVEAGSEALTAMRRDLPPAARRALAGVRRLIVSTPLP